MRPFSLSWYLSLSSYWFATNFKWSLVLLVLGPATVARLVPGGEAATRWGLVFGVGAILAVIGPPVVGWVSDRFPTRFGRRMPYLALGSVVTAAALVLMAHVPSFGMFMVSYLLLQLGDSLATGPYSALIPDLVPSKRRGTASGWMGVLLVLAQIAAGLVGFGLSASYFTTLFYLAAALNLLIAGWTLLVIHEPRGVPPRREAFLPSILAPWKKPDFRWVWGTRFLVMFGQYAVQTYLLLYLQNVVRTFDVFGHIIAQDAAQAVSLLLLLISVGAALSAAPTGRLSDRFGRKPVIYVAGVVLAALFVPFLIFHNYALILGLTLVFGLAYGAYVAVDWALVADVLPNPQGHATDMGLWQTSIVLPQVFIGFLGGSLARLNQVQPGSGYTFMFVLAASAFLLGTLLVRQIRGVR